MVNIEASGMRARAPHLRITFTHAMLNRLADLGFEPPGADNENHSQDIDLASTAAVSEVANTLATVLTEVFGVRDRRSLGIVLNLPGAFPQKSLA